MAELSIAGIVIVARDFTAQVEFYRDVLGLPMTDDWGDAVRLRATNGVTLTIFASTHDRRSVERLNPADHGLSHLEFGASQDVREATESRLAEAGHVSHGRNFLDADGQLFHFVTHTPER